MTTYRRTGELFVKAKLLNVWRVCPFIDVDRIMDEFDAHGAPVCLNRNVTSPTGSSPESFVPVDTYNDVDHGVAQLMIQATMVFMLVALAYGIPPWFESHADGKSYYVDFQAAGQRALEVTAHPYNGA